MKFAVALLSVLGCAAILAGQTETKTIEGEIIDQGCYVRQASHGPEHQECAARCLRNGNPAGVLTDDGAVYTLASTSSAFESFAAKKVRIGGTHVDRTIFPQTMEVWENDAWVEVPLSKFGAPETK